MDVRKYLNTKLLGPYPSSIRTLTLSVPSGEGTDFRVLYIKLESSRAAKMPILKWPPNFLACVMRQTLGF